MIPGLVNAIGSLAIGTSKPTDDKTRLQYVDKIQNFWSPYTKSDSKNNSSDGNPYYKNGDPKVVINPTGTVSMVPPPTAVPSLSKSLMVLPVIGPTMSKANTFFDPANFKQFLTTDFDLTKLFKPMVLTTSDFIIDSFDIVNGIWSLEWIYVLHYCGVNGYTALFDTTTNEYSYEGIDPCPECMLFQDPYIRADMTNKGELSSSAYALSSYCSIRNNSLAYFSNLPQDTACSCETDNTWCPTSMAASCKNASVYSIVTDKIAKDPCQSTPIGTFCPTYVYQNANSYNGQDNSNSDNKNIYVSSNSCTSNNGVPVGTGESGEDDDDDDDVKPIAALTDSKTWLWVLMAIVALILIAAIAYYFTTPGKDK
jgi:hypothetical protein